MPWLGGVRERIGMRGHWRSALLTKIALPPSAADRTHQAYEYIELMLPDHKNIAIDFPELRLPETMITEAQMKVASLKNPLAAILPGAARGPSKQWPARHFIELGRMLSEKGFGIVVLGSPKELPVCAEVADGTGSAAANLAGRTSLTELIALLKVCNVAVANDSGGMHLAAAVDTPVVGVYGMTDPSKTGPLCRVCRVVQNSSVRARDIARNSEEATKSLASVSPRQVYEAAMECMTTRESAP
jgi:heptosyltransferase-2